MKKAPKRKSLPFLIPLLKKLAPKIGAKIMVEPEWNTVGQILFKNGTVRYFRGSRIDLNTLGASEIAVDKDYATFFMNSMGYSTIPGRAFYSDKWHAQIGAKGRTKEHGYVYAKKIGFPVVIKPNSGTQGSGVQVAHNKSDFFKSIQNVFKSDKIALVQNFMQGSDYRIVVLDNKVISAYKRIPLNVTGNGTKTIKELLKDKQRKFESDGRDTRIKMSDPRIIDKLKHRGLTLNYKPKPGEKIFLLDNANLSTGGDSIDVTDIMHTSIRKLAIKLTKDMGLRICGVDIMIGGEIENKLKNYWIIEINAAPGLDHYVTTGKKQREIVESLYLQVLKNMGKKGNAI